MKIRISKNTLLLFLLLFAILVMGIGYAAINSITGEIRGTVIADIQQGVFITNVEDVSNVGADLITSEIKHYKGTMMQSTVKLSDTNSESEITYKVTVYNNSENSYSFLAVLYDEEFYDNPNIIFEISANGYKIGDIINSHETKDIYITFKYKDGVIPDNTVLNSYLNFKIAEPNRMVLANNAGASGNYLGGTVTKDKIETIKFELGNIAPEGTVSNFDASEKQDKSIIGYYTDTDGNGLYELTFASNEPIFANINAQFLFHRLTNLKSISFNNFGTFGVTNMWYMFYNCGELVTLDVSKFDTSQVNNMECMFSGCGGLTTLNMSGFDTNQVTNMAGMFAYCSRLVTLDVRGFNTSKVTTMESMFSGCSELTTLDVSRFDTNQVTNMWRTFFNCKGLTMLDVSGFNTGKVITMSGMFCYCSGLTTLNVSNFDTSQVKNMSDMFGSCSGLTILDLRRFDTSNVSTMASMFSNCNGLKILDIGSFDTSKVTNMNWMFFNCSGLTTIYASEFNSTTNTGWTTSAVTNSSGMFQYSNKLVGGNGTTYDSNHIDKEYARIDKAGTPGYFTNILRPPKIIVDKTSCDWRNSELNLTIIANGVSSGLATSNSYQYDLSNSETALSGGTWTNYTSGTAFEIRPEATGTYYLFIKRISDNAGNMSISDGTLTTISEEIYQRFGPYKFDYTAPQISVISDKLIRSYEGSIKTWKDLAGVQDGVIDGGSYENNYLHLDGVDDWVNLGEVNLTNKVTVDATITANEIQTGERDILSNFEGSGAGIYLNNGVPTFDVCIEGIGGVSCRASKSITVGEKTRITGTYDGTNASLYINGKLESRKAQTGTIITSSNNTVMAIGANPSGNQAAGRFTNINVYSAKVYDVALTDEEIANGANTTAGLLRSYDASIKPTWKDLTGVQDVIINGGTWKDDYLYLDGVNNWANLGEVDLTNQVTLDITILVNEIKNEETDILCNYENGGVGIYLRNGVPRFTVYINGLKYVDAIANNPITVGEKTRITGTYDGTNLSLYINGKLEVRKAQTGTIKRPDNNTVMAIGTDPSGNKAVTGFANINVYSARVYDNALTEEEIIRSYTEDYEHAIIRLSDPHSGLATGAQIQYGWSTSSTVQPSSWTNLNITGYSEGISNVTTTIIPSEATEKHYLWIKSETSAYVQDVVGNKTTTTLVSEKKY